jgi:hypothetical protein
MVNLIVLKKLKAFYGVLFMQMVRVQNTDPPRAPLAGDTMMEGEARQASWRDVPYHRCPQSVGTCLFYVARLHEHLLRSTNSLAQGTSQNIPEHHSLKRTSKAQASMSG